MAQMCGAGHPLEGANAIEAKRGDGRRFVRCRECERERDRERKQGVAGVNSWNALPVRVRERFREEVFARDGYRCRVRRSAKCSGRAEELDHIVPRRDGGALLDPANARASCRPCNRGWRLGRRGRSKQTPAPSREW